MGVLYRNAPDDQEELIGSLTERYADRAIRFDAGFVGGIPECCGRIGRRYFYFRFRGDSASLTVGSADHRRFASQAKAARRNSLRQLRRGVDENGFGSFMVRRDLRRENPLNRHPSRAVWYAVINDVTGEPYAGILDPEEAAELFVQLMDSLKLLPRSQRLPEYRPLRRGSSTMPLEPHRHVITKPSASRR